MIFDVFKSSVAKSKVARPASGKLNSYPIHSSILYIVSCEFCKMLNALPFTWENFHQDLQGFDMRLGFDIVLILAFNVTQ